MFKWYNRVPGASTNPENIKNNVFFGKPFSASFEKMSRSDFASPVMY